MYRNFFKRLFDVTISAVIVVLVAPIAMIIAVLCAVSNRGTPFFTQSRPGLNGRMFTVIKFKTMSDRQGPAGEELPDAERLTSFGEIVRKTSLDELPQLINVLKGDMSLVGPRPLLQEYLTLYSPEQARRHDVRPGITGWAQINGRNAISWEQKFKFDVWYVDNLSFGLDILILLRTFVKVIGSKDISQAGQATAVKFKGNR
jgi:lipopolysaccharide/colanic/teichoic acid biosynthesis glycosyltransferase